MKGMYSGNEDWLSRQRWIPIVLVAIAVIGGWAVGSRRQQAIADKHSEAQHARTTAVKPQAPKQAAPMPAGAQALAPARQAKVETVSAIQSPPTTVAVASTAAGTDNGGESLGDAAKRMKQHKACLELAKDNPSTPCK